MDLATNENESGSKNAQPQWQNCRQKGVGLEFGCVLN